MTGWSPTYQISKTCLWPQPFPKNTMFSFMLFTLGARPLGVAQPCLRLQERQKRDARGDVEGTPSKKRNALRRTNCVLAVCSR